jgi:hypothetical protein
MADGRRACRENDESKTGFAKTARFKVGTQTIDTVSVTVNPKSSVETQVSPGFSSISASVYGCVVVYADTAAGGGISVVTRRAITLGFMSTSVSGSNIVDTPATNTGTTATGVTATGTTATGTTATGTTATGVTATGTTATGVTTPVVAPAPADVAAPTGGVIGIPGEVTADDTTMEPIATESLPVVMFAGKRLDPEMLAIILENPILSAQIRGAGSGDPALAAIAGVIDVGTSAKGTDERAACSGYQDLTNGDEFCGYVRLLSTKKIVRQNASFEPDRPITRAELLKMAMLSSKLAPQYNAAYSYDDVAASDWWAPYISTAKKYGYISQTNREFRPNDSITRAEAIKILMNVSGRTSSYNAAYSYDDVAASDWWAPYISTAKKYGYISQTNREFRPNDSITRAESSKMVVMMTAERLLFE